MSKKYFFLIIITFIFSNHRVLAQTQAEMNQTANRDFQKADAELNKVYKQLMKTLDEKQKKLLITAQKNWLKFRVSHCTFEIEEFDGGSIQPLIYATCLTEQTNDRISQLKESLNREH